MFFVRSDSNDIISGTEMQSQNYQCSVDISEGFITTLRKKKNFGSKNKSTGYHSVMLKEIDSKYFAPYYVHRIVWETANGCKIPPGFHVHHQDGNKSNNSIFNLSLVSCKLNNWFAAQNRDYKAIFEKRKQNGFKVSVTAKCGKEETEFKSMRQAAKHFGVNVSTISGILAGKKYYNSVKRDGKEYTFVRS